MRNKVAILASFFLFTAFTASAKDKEPPSPCQNDIKTFCKKAKGGEEGTNKCLQEHAMNISVGCKTFMDEMAEYKEVTGKVKNLRKTCKTDLETLCPAVSKGGGRQLRCLRSQEAKLTSACKELMIQSGVMDMKAPVMQEAAKPVTDAPKAASATTTTTTTTSPAPATDAPAPAVPAQK